MDFHGMSDYPRDVCTLLDVIEDVYGYDIQYFPGGMTIDTGDSVYQYENAYNALAACYDEVANAPHGTFSSEEIKRVKSMEQEIYGDRKEYTHNEDLR